MIISLPQLLETNIDHFTGRTWLLPPLLAWLEQTKERMFILTGEPGAGKSSVIAWLAGAGPRPIETEARFQLEQFRALVKAAHFCIATSGNITPKAFAQSMANQLTRTVKGFGDALTATLADRVQISIKQHIGTVEASSVTGMYIEQFDLSDLGDEFSFDRILREPFQKLYTNSYDQPILLLVDGLDEAITYTGSINLIRLLAKLADLPEHIRLLVTTRSDPRVLKHYRGTKILDLIENAPPEVDDVRVYAFERLSILAEKDQIDLANRISQAAEGNFLYTHLVLNDLLSRLPDISDLSSLVLPKGLSGLYHNFLNRELGTNENRWYTIFRPLLGLLAVAQGEGLRRTQLERIIGQDVEWALRVCKQYLHGNLPDGPFRLFHKSFADFLIEDKGNVDYQIGASSMHIKIAKHCWESYRGNWEEMLNDSYCIEFLLEHLLQSNVENEISRRFRTMPPEKALYIKNSLLIHLIGAGQNERINKLIQLFIE